MNNRVPDFTYDLAEMIGNNRRRSGIEPIFLGGTAGSGGGVGTPPGGFIGQLVQRQVTYDTDESDLSLTAGSSSVLDNLNHIRARLSTVSKMWNRSGGSRATGDVVIQDITQIDSYKTTTTPNDTRFIGVVREPTTSGSQGYVTFLGYAAQVNVTGPTNIGDYLYCSATAGKASPTTSGSSAGLIGVALSSGSTSVSAILRPNGELGSSALSGAGISGRIAEWTGAASLGSSPLIKTGVGIMTLNAGADSNGSLPGTGRFALMDFNNQGNFGIGLTPAYPLHISGRGIFGASAFQPTLLTDLLQVSGSVTSGSDGLLVGALFSVAGTIVYSANSTQSRPLYVQTTLDTAGFTSLTGYSAYFNRPTVIGGGSFSDLATVRIIEPTSGTTRYGLWVGSSAGSAGVNYSLFLGSSNYVYLGTGNVGIGTTAPDHPLDVRGEISIFGASASLARLRLRGFYTSSPANPPNDQADIIIVDNGVTPVLRVRYNDAGVMKVGDLTLI